VICLTGDVHHMSMKGEDQPYLQRTEVDAAQKYIEIASNYRVKITLFITGKCVMEERQEVEKLLSNGNIELGGHTYRAFTPRLPYKLSYRLLNRKNGPWFLQSYEIRKTISIFKNFFNYDIVSWRDHAYRHDKNTPKLLKKAGIQYFSDIVSPKYMGPFQKGSLYYVPINVLPDHDYIYHGSRLPGTFDESCLLSSEFRTKAMSVDQWLVTVKVQVKKTINGSGLATILAHPSCMEICDNFRTFEKLCQFISQYKTVYMKEIGQEYAQDSE